MGKIRKTKTELKAQRDALKRYEKYLPTLELKKQQLRIEVSRMSAALEKKREEKAVLRSTVKKWIRLYAEDIDIDSLITVKEVDITTDNIAGVDIPVCEGVTFERPVIDLYATPPWIDDGLEVAKTLIRMEIEEQILHTALSKLSEELRITSQRVNLFEKVKIPQSRENIRIIRIALGDEQAAAVARAKIAKTKRLEMDSASL